MSLFESAPRKRYPVEFNAGKCIVEGNTVKPDLRKGKIYMDQVKISLLTKKKMKKEKETKI